jgi:NhaC family Na+:H+ antiporter
MNKRSEPTFFQSVITILVLMVFLVLNMWLLDDDPLKGGSQMALLMASLVAGGIAWFNGVRWKEMQQGITDTVSQAVTAIIVLLFIGTLAASWMLGGIIPALIHYGLYILHPGYFLPAVVVISALISVGTGSSWSTIATVGVAFLGIGNSLGFSNALTAGAIISGAYFGDKVSPLSDTTNLASAVSGVDLFKHIRYMMNTTVPTIVLTIVIFAVISLFGSRNADIDVGRIHAAIQGTFNVTPWVFLVLALVGWMIYKKLPAVVTLFLGSLLGLLSALLFQPGLVHALAGSGSVGDIFTLLLGTLYKGNDIVTGCADVDGLLSTSGMSGMLNTIWLIVSAMVFGGVMMAGGFLQKITSVLIAKVASAGGLVSTTAVSCILFNILTADQYITIVLSGKMYSEAFRKERLAPEVLSRTIEDSGTVTSVLVPWNSCGATQAAVLGVPTLAYLPFCFFCYLSPLMTMLFAWLNIRIHRADLPEKAAS